MYTHKANPDDRNRLNPHTEQHDQPADSLMWRIKPTYDERIKELCAARLTDAEARKVASRELAEGYVTWNPPRKTDPTSSDMTGPANVYTRKANPTERTA